MAIRKTKEAVIHVTTRTYDDPVHGRVVKVQHVCTLVQMVYECKGGIEIYSAGDRRRVFRNDKGNVVYVSNVREIRGSHIGRPKTDFLLNLMAMREQPVTRVHMNSQVTRTDLEGIWNQE